MKENWKKYLAECVGTAVLTLVACGVAAYGDYVGTALAFGLVIVAMAYSIGNVSGCHINPAVSLAFFLRKELSLKDFLFYVASQFVGALAGSALLVLFFNNYMPGMGVGQNVIQPLLLSTETGKANAYSYIVAFVVEVVLTFIFVIAILGATDKRYHDGKHAPIVIGLALTLVHLMGLNLTGTSVNPARSFAPALVMAFYKDTTSISQVWIWLLAPLAGAALAAVVYTVLTKGKEAKAAE